MLVDLHIHTNASDGTWDRNELIEELVENFQFKHIIEIIQCYLQGGEQ